jgi:hypothetical protein
MTHSNKIITTTTQLISEEKIKKMALKIQPGFQIWTPDSLDVSMILKGNKMNMIISSITDMNSSLLSFEYVQGTLDTIENILSNEKNDSKNILFFVPSDVNYSLK